MSLSPYLNPTNLNGALQSSSKFGEILYRTDEYDALDKRNHSYVGTDDGRYSIATGGIYNSASQAISSIKDISDSIENAFGSRSPMYVIGEIDEDTWYKKNSGWVPNAVKGLVRAVSDLAYGKKQEGVIIDGLGDVEGNFSVDFTSNPVLFRSASIIDNRFRVPSKLKMTVFVSNYLNDDITGTLTDAIGNLDPTGLVSEYANQLGRQGNTRAQWTLYKLRWLMENAQPFQVYTPHGVYDNMVIKSISPRTDANTMDMLYCDIEFQELILYAPYTTDIGKIPARKGITAVRSGWTKEALKNANALW